MKRITPAQARAIFDALVDDRGRFGKVHLRTYHALKEQGFAEFREPDCRIFVTQAGYEAAREYYGHGLRAATLGTAWTNKQQTEQEEQNQQRRAALGFAS